MERLIIRMLYRFTGKNKPCVSTILFLTFTLIQTGCQNFDLFRNLSENLPAVEMTSVEMYHDSVLMIGKITDEGATSVELCGFCYNLTGNPSMNDNQVLLNGTVGEFGVLLGNMLPETRYYIKSFAYSSCGYVLSETVIFNVGVAGPPTVPCQLPENVVTIEGIGLNVTSAVGGEQYAYAGNYGIDINCNSGTPSKIELDFNEKPVNGIYTTCPVTSLAGGGKVVYAEAKMSGNGYTLDYGGLVYVTELENGNLEVAFCSLYVYVFDEYKLSGWVEIQEAYSDKGAGAIRKDRVQKRMNNFDL